MKLRTITGFCVALSLASAGCNSSEVLNSPPTKKPETVKATDTAQGQPRLPTVKVWLGPRELVAEQAVTEVQRQTGMMFRKEMPENEAMLFVFPFPAQLAFWMKNTFVPLSCAYIDPEGVILEIRDMKPLDETPLDSKSHRVQFVLETNQGWFERNNIKTGMVVRTEKGSLAETYFRRK